MRQRHAHDKDDDDVDDPIESDMDESDEPELVACPYCRKMIGEDAQRCHHCGNYILPDDTPGRIPWWLLVGAVLAAVAVLTWVLA